MNIKKLTAVLLIMLLSMTVLAACQDTNGETGTDTPDGTPSETTPGDREPFVISSWADAFVPFTALNPTQDLQIERIEEAEELYNISVEYKVRPHGEYASSFIAATLAGDKWCDLFMGNRPMLPTLARNNIIYSLEDYLDFDSDILDNQYRDIALWAGERYGFAWEYVYANMGIWYNMNIFEREGLEDPYDIMQRGEWTFDKFREIARELTKDTTGDGAIDQWGISNVFTDLANGLLIANMADFVEEEEGGFVFALTEPHAMEAIQFAYDLWHDGYVFAADERDAFASGEAAMSANVSFAGGWYKGLGMEDLGFIFLPKGPNADEYTSGVSGGKYFSVPTTVDDPQRAAEIGLHIYAVWDESRDNFISFEEMSYDGAEAQMFNQRDMETFFEIQRVQRFINTAMFSEVWEIVLTDVYAPLQARESTPAQAIEAIRLRAESAIANVGDLDDMLGD